MDQNLPSLSIFPHFQVQEMDQNLPTTCKTKFSNPNLLHEFTMVVTPDEGYWRGGKFVFSVSVPEEYNMAVSLKSRMEHLSSNPA